MPIDVEIWNVGASTDGQRDQQNLLNYHLCVNESLNCCFSIFNIVSLIANTTMHCHVAELLDLKLNISLNCTYT